MAAPIVLVGPPVGTPTTNITVYVDVPTLSIEDTGNQADDTANLEVLDKALTVTSLAPNGRIKVTQDGEVSFNGFIKTLEPAWEGISRRFRVSCVGISELLDKCIVPPSGTAYVRNNSESDKARIQWLLNTFGSPFLTAGSSSFTYIQTLEPDMPRQNFANMTLRQAIERVLGAASESANYYVDTLGRLHTWDNLHEEASTAPFDIVTGTPSATQVAPSDLRVMWDTGDLVNYYYVRGKNAAGSGPESDATSIATYGRWQAFIDGPDSDTTRKQRRLGKAALKDTKNPIIRTNFTVELDYCENGAGEIWRPGQQVLITSPAHGMTGYQIRVIRVTTSYLNGLGDRRMEVECGALRAAFGGPDQWGGTGPSKYPDPSIEMFVRPGPTVIDGPGPGQFWQPADITTEYVIDDYIRPAPLHAVWGTLASATEWDVPIPDGSLAGMLLIAYVTSDHQDLDPIPAGWTLALDTSFDGGTAATRHGYHVLTHVVTGLEGYTGTGDTVRIEKDGTADFLDYWVGQVSGAGVPLFNESSGAAGNADPPLSDIGPAAIGNLYLALAGVKGSDGLVSVTAAPTGYTADTLHPGDASIDGRNGVGVAWKWSTATTDDPGTFTNTSKAWLAATVMIPAAGLGFLPVPADGAWWEGTNAYIVQNGGGAGTYGIADGILWCQAEDAGGATLNVFIFQLDGYTESGIITEPELPIAVGTWSKSGRFRFSRDDPSSVVMRLEAGSGNILALHPPSSTEGTGIRVESGANNDDAAWAMVDDAWYRYRWERDEQSLEMRARVWADAATEPTAWDVTCDVDITTDVASSLVLTVQLGNDDQVTPGQRWEMDWRKARRPVLSGQSVVGDILAVADGATSTFALPFVPRVGSWRFYVDGIATPPLSIDYDAPSVTFTSAPSSFARITWDAVRA